MHPSIPEETPLPQITGTERGVPPHPRPPATDNCFSSMQFPEQNQQLDINAVRCVVQASTLAPPSPAGCIAQASTLALPSPDGCVAQASTLAPPSPAGCIAQASTLAPPSPAGCIAQTSTHLRHRLGVLHRHALRPPRPPAT